MPLEQRRIWTSEAPLDFDGRIGSAGPGEIGGGVKLLDTFQPPKVVGDQLHASESDLNEHGGTVSASEFSLLPCVGL
jgi:hypothetical protein